MAGERTTGELEIKLDTIIEQLSTLQRTVVTKDLFDTWRQGNNERVGRIEVDMKEWIQTSTAAHVKLEADSKSRHQKAETDLDALEVKMEARWKAADDRAFVIEQSVKATNEGKIRQWVGAGLAVIGTLITSALVSFFISNGGPS